MDLTSLFDIGGFAQAFSSNVYVSGILMILLNVGTSYLMQDITPIAHRLFSSFWVRRMVFFAIFFTATRDLKVSVVLMILFTLLVDLFLNEDSSFCLIPYQYRQKQPNQTETSALHGGNHTNTHSTSIQANQNQSQNRTVPASSTIDQNAHHLSHTRNNTDSFLDHDLHTHQNDAQQSTNTEHFTAQAYTTTATVPQTRFALFKRNAERWSSSRQNQSIW